MRPTSSTVPAFYGMDQTYNIHIAIRSLPYEALYFITYTNTYLYQIHSLPSVLYFTLLPHLSSSSPSLVLNHTMIEDHGVARQISVTLPRKSPSIRRRHLANHHHCHEDRLTEFWVKGQEYIHRRLSRLHWGTPAAKNWRLLPLRRPFALSGPAKAPTV